MPDHTRSLAKGLVAAGHEVNKSLRQRIGRATRRRVLSENTVERMVERTLDVYRIGIDRLGQQRREWLTAGSSTDRVPS